MRFTCHYCGKEVERLYRMGEYIYKKFVMVNGVRKVAYFCGWNCYKKYEKKVNDYDEK